MDQNVSQELLTKDREYRMPQQAVELLSQHKPLILAGVTAAGKNSICERLELEGTWRHVITHTTRPSREGEQNGKNYWFVDNAQMLKLMDSQSMIEVNLVHGETFYGTSLAAYENVLAQGHKPLLIMDIQGVEDVTKHVPNLQPVFILPPSFEVWMDRLDHRGKMSHVERKRRIGSALKELEVALHSKHFKLVVNHDITETARDILMGKPDMQPQQANLELIRSLIAHITSY